MKRHYVCKHSAFEINSKLILVHCRKCRSEIFSIEDIDKIEKTISKIIGKNKRKTISKSYLEELIEMSFNKDKKK